MNVEGCYFCQDETGSDDPHCGNIEDHDDDVTMVDVDQEKDEESVLILKMVRVENKAFV